MFEMTFAYASMALRLPPFRLDYSNDLYVFYPGETSNAGQFLVGYRRLSGTIAPLTSTPWVPPTQDRQEEFMRRVKERKICVILGMPSLKAFLDTITPLAIKPKLKFWRPGDVELIKLKDGSWFIALFTYDPGVTAWARNNPSFTLAITAVLGHAWELAQICVPQSE